MSITFEIVKFKKPTKDDLSKIHMFNPYGYIPILDDDGDSTGWNIYMFRVDDKDIQNIINSSYAVKMAVSYTHLDVYKRQHEGALFMTEQKQRRKPRKYTDEFKQQLVELYRSGKRRCDICREYDIATSLFDKWVKGQHHEFR